MRLDVHPDPPPEEREALELALRRVLGSIKGATPSAWWQEGVRENVLDEDEF